MTDAIPLAVIGGTGLEQAFDALEERLEIDTPYGPTSEPVAVGEIAGRRVDHSSRRPPAAARLSPP